MATPTATRKPRKKPAPKPDTLTVDPLTFSLEVALSKSGKSTTMFCYEHFGDPTFMLKARQGRKFHKASLVQKIHAVLAAYGVEVVE